MLTKFIAIILLAFSVATNAQTFPVVNLNVTGTATFAISPTGPTPTIGDNSTKFATTAFVGTAIAGSGFPTVATNAALAATSTATTSKIVRISFATAGDTSPLIYTAQSSPCSAPDNGNQVTSADGNCWIAQWPAGPHDVTEWGADKTGIANSTAAMNAAHATGAVIFYPAGTFTFTTLNSIASGGIVGLGRDATLLKSTDTSSNNLIVFNSSAHTPILRDFSLQAPNSSNLPVKSGGACIQLNPISGEIDYAHFDNITIAFCPIEIDFTAAAYWTINNSEFLGYNSAGIQVANTNNNDSGDSVVQGSLFNTPGTTGSAINWKSSGGLKIIGNKMLGGGVGFNMQFNGTTNTSDIILVGNSIENMNTQAIVLARASGSANVSNVVVVGNQMAVEPTCLQSDASSFINEFTYTGNVCNLSNGSGYGVNIATITDYYIGGNTFKGNGGTPAGIVLASSNSNGKLGKNTYATLSSSLTNNSTTTFVDQDIETGTTTTASSGWSSYGSLFSSPTTNVTFPTAYTVAPTAANITLTPTSTNGVSGAIVTGVSTTGFSYIALSGTTNIAASFSWQAGGTK